MYSINENSLYFKSLCSPEFLEGFEDAQVCRTRFKENVSREKQAGEWNPQFTVQNSNRVSVSVEPAGRKVPKKNGKHTYSQKLEAEVQ